MFCKMLFSALVFLLGLAFATAGAPSDRTKTEDVNIKPGGVEHSFKSRIGKYECSFTYAAQGGTNEDWLMSVGISDDDQMFSCSIWRPQGRSYLFFTQFKAEVKGLQIMDARAYSQSAPTDVELKTGEITVRDSTVTHTEGKFSAQLAKLTVIAKIPHEEL